MAVTRAPSSAELDKRLKQLEAAAPAGINVTSEVRSAAQQQALWDAALQKYGSVAEARKWVAPPGHSQHELGHAADLAFATPEARQWAHDNAARFGLTFPLSNEPWHIEVVGSRNVGPTAPTNPLGADVQTATPQFQANPTLSIQQYGAIAALAHTNSDLAKLMAKYANEDLSNSAVQMRLEGEIKNTKWYKTTTDAQRAAQTLRAANPTEYHRQFANALMSATNIANQLGVHLPGLGLHDFAVKAYTNGWTPEEQKQFLLAEGQKAHNYADTPAVAGKPGHPGQPEQEPTGDIGATLTKLQSAARDYLVPISDATQQQWAQKIMTGQVQENDYLNYLKEQAKSLFPGMGAAIDSGVTPSTYTDPYKQIAAQTLEVPPDSVNFSDPKWSKALFQVDPKTGARTSMSLADWGKTLRSDPTYGYGKTIGAQKQASDFAENILSTFGAIGNYGGNG